MRREPDPAASLHGGHDAFQHPHAVTAADSLRMHGVGDQPALPGGRTRTPPARPVPPPRDRSAGRHAARYSRSTASRTGSSARAAQATAGDRTRSSTAGHRPSGCCHSGSQAQPAGPAFPPSAPSPGTGTRPGARRAGPARSGPAQARPAGRPRPAARSPGAGSRGGRPHGRAQGWPRPRPGSGRRYGRARRRSPGGRPPPAGPGCARVPGPGRSEPGTAWSAGWRTPAPRRARAPRRRHRRSARRRPGRRRARPAGWLVSPRPEDWLVSPRPRCYGGRAGCAAGLPARRRGMASPKAYFRRCAGWVIPDMKAFLREEVA